MEAMEPLVLLFPAGLVRGNETLASIINISDANAFVALDKDPSTGKVQAIRVALEPGMRLVLNRSSDAMVAATDGLPKTFKLTKPV